MNALAAALRDEISRDGPITLARYMEQALGHPTLGYYRNRDPLGTRGDFTTAPEISQMFGEMIGAWLAVAWQQSGSPDLINLVEIGPGRGTMMSDALRVTRAVAGFHGSIKLHLVETSEPLRAAQATAMAHCGVSATWHDSCDNLPSGPLLLVANEFFDALPVHQFEQTRDGWRERLITFNDQDGDRFRLVLSDAAPPFTPPMMLQDAPLGSVWETSPQSQATIRALAGRIAADGGVALIIDYGYGQPSCGESLQALRAHHRHDPLAEPGSADITAHVDFTALGASAAAAGAKTYGPIDQGPFLTGLGLAARAERLRAAALARNRPDQAAAIATAYKRVSAPTEMGSLFKALAFSAANQPAPPGFTAASQSETP